MKGIFFRDSENTSNNGVVLKAEHVQTLRRLIEAVHSLEKDDLACRISTHILERTDWENVMVLLETPGDDKDVIRLHINLPNKGPIAQMEIYTWRDEDEEIRIGVGSAETEEFALVKLGDPEIKKMAEAVISEAR